MSTMSLREQLHTAILQCSKHEQLLLIEIQKLQEKAVILDGLLESLDEGNLIDTSTIPKIPFGFTQITKYTHIESKQLYEMFIEAIQRGDEKEVDELLQEGNRLNPSVDNNLAIRCASENGNLAVVNRLLQDERVDPSANNNWAIRWASQNGHLAVVDRLLQDTRVDPSACNNCAIRWASEYGNLAVVDRLLQDPRVDPSADNNWAIRWASQNGHLAVDSATAWRNKRLQRHIKEKQSQ
jgi:hypothetical protein